MFPIKCSQGVMFSRSSGYQEIMVTSSLIFKSPTSIDHTLFRVPTVDALTNIMATSSLLEINTKDNVNILARYV